MDMYTTRIVRSASKRLSPLSSVEIAPEFNCKFCCQSSSDDSLIDFKEYLGMSSFISEDMYESFYHADVMYLKTALYMFYDLDCFTIEPTHLVKFRNQYRYCHLHFFQKLQQFFCFQSMKPKIKRAQEQRRKKINLVRRRCNAKHINVTEFVTFTYNRFKTLFLSNDLPQEYIDYVNKCFEDVVLPPLKTQIIAKKKQSFEQILKEFKVTTISPPTISTSVNRKIKYASRYDKKHNLKKKELNFMDFLTDEAKKKLQEIIKHQVQEGIVIEKATRQSLVSAAKDALCEAGLDLTAAIADVNVDKFVQLLDHFKPINISNLIMQWKNCTTKLQRFGVYMAVLELYGFLWTHELKPLKELILSVIHVLVFELANYMSSDDKAAVRQALTVEIEENSPIKTLCDKLGIEDTEKVPKWIMMIIGGISIIFMLITGGTIKCSKLDFSHIISKAITNLGSMTRNMNFLVDGLPKIYELALQSLSSLFGYKVLTEDVQAREFKADLLEFEKEVQALYDEVMNDPMSVLDNQLKFLKMRELKDELHEKFTNLLKLTKNVGNVKIVFDDLVKKIDAIHTLSKNIEYSQANKREPVCIFLVGPAGIGKSLFSHYIMDELGKRMFGRKLSTYSRKSNEKHWAGYVHQDVVIIDDFGSSKDDLDHDDVMIHKNPTKSSVYMSESKEKGRQFTSKFIILNSNDVVNQSATIKHLPALHRRLEIHIEVHDPNMAAFQLKHKCTPSNYKKTTHKEPKIEGKNGKLINYWSKNFSHLQFTRVDKTNITDTRYPVTAEDILKLAENYYREYDRIFRCQSQQTYVECDGFEMEEEDDANRVIPNELPSYSNEKLAMENKQKYYDQINKDVINGQYTAADGDIIKDRVTNSPIPITKHIFRQIVNIVLQTSKQSAPFTQLNYPKGRIYAMSGQPGTGKTFIMKALERDFGDDCQYIEGKDLKEGFIPSKRILLINDITVHMENFDVIYKLIANSYDDTSFIKLIVLTYNDQILKDALSEQQFNVFERRLKKFTFDYLYRSKISYYKFTAKDVEQAPGNISSMVSIKDNNSKNYSHEQVISLIKDLSSEFAASVVRCNCVPIVPLQNITPDFDITYNGNLNTWFKSMYDNRLMMSLSLAQISVTKGQYGRLLAIMKKFYVSTTEKIEYPDDIFQFIRLINSANYPIDEKFSILIRGTDNNIYISVDDEGFIRAFSAELCTIEGNVVTSPTITLYLNALSRNIYDSCGVSQTPLEESDIVTLIGYEKLLNNKIFKMALELTFFAAKLGAATTAIIGNIKYHNSRELALALESNKGKNKIAHYAKIGAKYAYDGVEEKMKQNSAWKNKTVRDCANMFYQGSWHWSYFDEDSDFHQFIETYRGESMPPPPQQTPITLFQPLVESAPPPVQVQPINLVPILNLEQINRKIDIGMPLPHVNTKFEEIPGQLKECAVRESQIDGASRDMISLVKHNMIEVGQMSKDGKFFKLCNGLMGFDKYGITVAHVKHLFTHVNVKGAIFEVKIMDVKEQNDTLIFEVTSKQCPSFQNILHHLPLQDEKYSQLVKNKHSFLILPDAYSQNTHDVLIYGTKIDCVTTNVVDDDSNFIGIKYKPFLSSLNMKVAIGTEKGDCGGVILLNDPTARTKIVGLHCAAGDFNGVASMVFRNLFDCVKSMKQANDVGYQELPIHDFKIHKPTHTFLGMPVVAESEVAAHIPTKTCLWTSPLALTSKPLHEPSILSLHDDRNKLGVDPFYKNVGDWMQLPSDIDEELLQRCENDIAFWYSSKLRNYQVKTEILTKTEAINKKTDVAMKPLNRYSSSGFPWKHYGGNKQDFLIDKGNDQCAYYSINLTTDRGKKLNNNIDKLIHMCRTPNKVKPVVVFSSSLKDEPIKLQKIYDVKTRAFAGSPMCYSIAHRMYFATILAGLHEVRGSMPIQIGMDPTSLEWHIMISEMLQVSSKGFDLDFASWDKLLTARMLEIPTRIWIAIAKATNSELTQEDINVMKNLRNPLIKPLLGIPYQGKTVIVEAPGGMMSGQPATADENSLIHLVLIYYAYLKIMLKRQPQIATLYHFIKYVCCKIYGDDGIYSIHPEILELFNFVTVQEIFNELGLQCQPAKKNGEIVKYFDVMEMEFLKRSTVRIGKYYFGRLNDKTMIRMLAYCKGPKHFWYKEKKTVFSGRMDDLVQTANAALRESVFYGVKFYEGMCNHLIERMADITEWIPPCFNDFIVQMMLPIDYKKTPKLLPSSPSIENPINFDFSKQSLSCQIIMPPNHLQEQMERQSIRQLPHHLVRRVPSDFQVQITLRHRNIQVQLMASIHTYINNMYANRLYPGTLQCQQDIYYIRYLFTQLIHINGLLTCRVCTIPGLAELIMQLQLLEPDFTLVNLWQ